jgi:hypothetical protein
MPGARAGHGGAAGGVRPPLDERLARVAYETTRAWGEASGEPAKKPWDQAEPWRRDSAKASVRQALAGATSEQLHEDWRKRRKQEGWKPGAKKDEAAKTNPGLRPFAQLTDTQRRAADLFATAVHTVFRCGIERWSVKTLTDPGAGTVDLAHIEEGAVPDLVGLQAPHEPTERETDAERTVYRLHGEIVIAKLEADKDMHLVLRDAGGATMIVESPSPDCTGTSAAKAKMTEARRQAEALFPEAAAGGREEPKTAVVVEGVGFFDRLHGQEGVAPNGIELHPLLGIKPDAAAAP